MHTLHMYMLARAHMHACIDAHAACICPHGMHMLHGGLTCCFLRIGCGWLAGCGGLAGCGWLAGCCGLGAGCGLRAGCCGWVWWWLLLVGRSQLAS